jgi:hypothetical protein
MKTFKLFQHPTQGFEAVKIGFSWPAFFFGLIWMLIKKLWGFAGFWFVAYVICVILESVIDQSSAGTGQALAYLILAAAYFALWLIPGFKGNAWREENLKQRGYIYLGDIQADNPDSAIAQQSAKGDTASTSKTSAKPNPPPTSQSFAGFQDIPDKPRKSDKPNLELPKGNG